MLEGGLDWRVFGFCGAMALCTGVLFGLVPAMRAARTELWPGDQAHDRGGVGASCA